MLKLFFLVLVLGLAAAEAKPGLLAALTAYSTNIGTPADTVKTGVVATPLAYTAPLTYSTNYAYAAPYGYAAAPYGYAAAPYAYYY